MVQGVAGHGLEGRDRTWQEKAWWDVAGKGEKVPAQKEPTGRGGVGGVALDVMWHKPPTNRLTRRPFVVLLTVFLPTASSKCTGVRRVALNNTEAHVCNQGPDSMRSGREAADG